MGLAKDPYTSLFLGAQIFTFGILFLIAGIFFFAFAFSIGSLTLKIISGIWISLSAISMLIGRFL